MRSYGYLILAILELYLGRAQAQTGTNFDWLQMYSEHQLATVSRPSDRLVMFYCPHSPTGKLLSAKEFDASQKIDFGFILTTNILHSVLFVLKPEYGFRISAMTESNSVVLLTKLGKRFGSHFNDVGVFDKNVVEVDPRDPPRRMPNWVYVSFRDEQPSLGHNLPSPDQLFNLPTPGRYTIIIEAACFVGDDPIPQINSTNYHLVKFPPVKLQIIKKEH
jgi:hypothetical protein